MHSGWTVTGTNGRRIVWRKELMSLEAIKYTKQTADSSAALEV